jgi:hypothetical protein
MKLEYHGKADIEGYTNKLNRTPLGGENENKKNEKKKPSTQDPATHRFQSRVK